MNRELILMSSCLPVRCHYPALFYFLVTIFYSLCSQKQENSIEVKEGKGRTLNKMIYYMLINDYLMRYL